MENWKKRALDLLSGLALTEKGDPSVVPYYPQKTAVPGDAAPYFRRTAPERQGVSSRRISDLITDLEAERNAHVHTLLILRGGEIISECAAPGYSIHTPCLSHSMSKTVTGMAVGMLWEEGKLNLEDPILRFFPEVRPVDKNYERITVRHALTMTTGVSFGEAGAVTEEHWTEGYFGAPLRSAPGEVFSYNSMNSYILANIVTRVSKKTLCDYLKPRLFDPLGIRQYLWEMGPEGCEKGGWGLYLCPEDWAKLGWMMLCGGRFAGHRILSEKWVSDATSPQADTSGKEGDFDYGYHLWVERGGGSFLFNGMLGQNVWVCPRQDTVAVITAGNNELFSESPALSIVRKYLGEDARDGLRRSDARGLREKEENFFRSRMEVTPLVRKRTFLSLFRRKSAAPLPAEWEALCGTYHFPANNAGALPVFVSAMQNNYGGGIRAVTVAKDGSGLRLTVEEESGTTHLPLGLYGFGEGLLRRNGETYRVRALGEVTYDRSGVTLYRVLFIFPELPNSRMWEFSFPDPGVLSLRMSEVPDNRIMEPLLRNISQNSPRTALLLNFAQKRLGDDFFAGKLAAVFHPVLMGACTGSERYEEILAAQEAARQARLAKMAQIAALLARFSGAEREEKAAGPGAMERLRGSVIGGLFGKWFGKRDRDTDSDMPDTDETAPASEGSPAAPDGAATGSSPTSRYPLP